MIADGFCACLCGEASVTVWNGHKFEQIFSEDSFEPVGRNKKWELGNKYISLKRSSDDTQTNVYSETYYELKDNKLLPLKKKPQG
jgi:hypothetical protein